MPTRVLRIHNETRDAPLADRALLAATFGQRFVGLMGRRELPVGEGLLIQPCNSIHTFFMKIAIDVAFLDGEGVIVKQFDALPPWRATRVFFKAKSVLELPAGTLAASGTREGDRLSVRLLSGKHAF